MNVTREQLNEICNLICKDPVLAVGMVAGLRDAEQAGDMSGCDNCGNPTLVLYVGDWKLCGDQCRKEMKEDGYNV